MDMSQAIGSFPLAWQPLVVIPPSASSLWIDLFKTLAATFLGAGLAFFSNYHFQNRQRRSEQKTAGNVALATLSRQYGEYVIAKAAVEYDLRNASSKDPQIPVWLALQPTLFEMNSELLFDFKSVAFLVDESDLLLERLVDVETKYHDLRRMLSRHSDISTQVARKFSELGWDKTIKEEFAKNGIGSAMIEELHSLTEAIARRVATQEDIYIMAGNQLEELMRTKFEKGVFAFRALGAKKGLAKLDTASSALS